MKPFLLLFFSFLGAYASHAQISAFYDNDKIEITWSNSDIKNLDYFVIEKSKNGKTFKSFLKVDALDKNYSSFLEIDYKPYKHVSYYRIRYVNKMGNYYYSETIAAKNHAQENLPELKNYNKLNVLVVLKNLSGNECYAKLNIKEQNGELVAETLNERLKTGKYLIIGTEDDSLLGYNLKILNRNPSLKPEFNQFSDSLHIK